MDTLREKNTELLRAFLLSAIGAAVFLLAALAFALACGSWLLPLEAAPAFTRAALFLISAAAVFLSVRGSKGTPAIQAAAACSVLLLLPLLSPLLSGAKAFSGLPFLTSLLAVVLGAALGLGPALRRGRRKRRRRR